MYSIFNKDGVLLSEESRPKTALLQARYLADEYHAPVEICSNGRAQLICHPGGLYEKYRGE